MGANNKVFQSSSEISFVNLIFFLATLHNVCCLNIDTTNNTSLGKENVINVESGGACPITVDLDNYNPAYTVNIKSDCDTAALAPCNVNFYIRDELQASAFEICGDLRDIDAGSCSAATQVGLTAEGGYSWLMRILCRPFAKTVACSRNSIQLRHTGLTPCANFGKAYIKMTPIFSPNIYYLDSEDKCSTQDIHRVKTGTIMSEHSLSDPKVLPEYCQLSIISPYQELRIFCIKFSFAKFSCLDTLTVENARTSTTLLSYSCNNVPDISTDKCFEGQALDQYNFHLKRHNGSAGHGFMLTFEFLSFHPLTTTATHNPTVFTSQSTPEGEKRSTYRTSTIAITISVIVAVSLVVIIIKMVNSKYCFCCKRNESEQTPEQDQVHYFSDDVGATVQGEHRATPSAPQVTFTRYDCEGPGVQYSCGGSEDGMTATENSQNQPPPSYDSLFINP